MTRRGFWSQVARIWTTTLLIIVERPETAHSTLLGLSFLNKEMEMLLASTGSLNCLSKYIWKFPEQCLAHEKLSIGENCIYVYIQLIHFIVQQTLTQYCKATTPQLKKKKTGNYIIWGKQCAMFGKVHGPHVAISQPQRSPKPTMWEPLP